LPLGKGGGGGEIYISVQEKKSTESKVWSSNEKEEERPCGFSFPTRKAQEDGNEPIQINVETGLEQKARRFQPFTSRIKLEKEGGGGGGT